MADSLSILNATHTPHTNGTFKMICQTKKIHKKRNIYNYILYKIVCSGQVML